MQKCCVALLASCTLLVVAQGATSAPAGPCAPPRAAAVHVVIDDQGAAELTDSAGRLLAMVPSGDSLRIATGVALVPTDAATTDSMGSASSWDVGSLELGGVELERVVGVPEDLPGTDASTSVTNTGTGTLKGRWRCYNSIGDPVTAWYAGDVLPGTTMTFDCGPGRGVMWEAL